MEQPTATVAVAGWDTVTFGPATFWMGDDGDRQARESPAHEVHLSPFAIATRCVTAADYHAFMVSPGFQPQWCDYIDPCFVLRLGTGFEVRPGCGEFPMVQVTFTGCAAYCNWLSAAEGLDQVYDIATGTGDPRRNGYRLPTEAEWEYACWRSYPSLDGLPPRDQGEFNYRDARPPARLAWASMSGLGGFACPPESPVPVGSLPPSPHTGMFEMLGNVREWCHDRYCAYTPQPQWDPAGAGRGWFRVVRGGSYLDPAEILRPHVRAAVHQDNKCMQYGFRVARSL